MRNPLEVLAAQGVVREVLETNNSGVRYREAAERAAAAWAAIPAEVHQRIWRESASRGTPGDYFDVRSRWLQMAHRYEDTLEGQVFLGAQRSLDDAYRNVLNEETRIIRDNNGLFADSMIFNGTYDDERNNALYAIDEAAFGNPSPLVRSAYQAMAYQTNMAIRGTMTLPAQDGSGTIGSDLDAALERYGAVSLQIRANNSPEIEPGGDRLLVQANRLAEQIDAMQTYAQRQMAANYGEAQAAIGSRWMENLEDNARDNGWSREQDPVSGLPPLPAGGAGRTPN
jgi:hypothetical protein